MPKRTAAAASGEHKARGLLFLALADDEGRLPWPSAAHPGHSSEISTARYDRLVERLRAHEPGAFGGLGFSGSDDEVDSRHAGGTALAVWGRCLRDTGPTPL
ncbi:hypothetical protein [Streptomyces sp. NPDC048106]|uniref:hypothetical protein n=1 Tax=Streptomyces sp. NPDC048106 TaxID=3155750 RepID=UPI0034550801